MSKNGKQYRPSQEALTEMLFEYRLKYLLVFTGCSAALIAVVAYFGQFYFLDSHPISLKAVTVVAGIGCTPAVKYFFSGTARRRKSTGPH